MAASSSEANIPVGESPLTPEQNSEAPLDNSTTTSDLSTERLARFKSLQARAKKSAEHNIKEAAAESQRLSTDQSQLAALMRKRGIASHNILKADTAASGDDFERKRAWDWTIEESEKWDKRMAKKQRNRENTYFQDFHQESNKVYKRQIREMKPDMEAYQRAKDQAIQQAVQSGDLELNETEDGEVIAVSKDGNSYSSADIVGFVEKADKGALDRLVNDLNKAEEVRMRKRRNRGKAPDDPDVTYINDKNKQFNQKLARYFDPYTKSMRENLERGTAI